MPYPTEIRNRALAMLRDGETTSKVAGAIGCSAGTITVWAKQEGIKVARASTKARTFEPSGLAARSSRFLTALRDYFGLTQPQMAERVGLTLSTYAKWDTGKRVPTLRSLAKIADSVAVESVVLVVVTKEGHRLELDLKGAE